MLKLLDGSDMLVIILYRLIKPAPSPILRINFI